MLTLVQALRRSALVTLGFAALAGTAAAQGTANDDTNIPPSGNDTVQPTAEATPQPAPQPAPMASDTGDDTTVIVQPPPQPYTEPQTTYVTQPVVTEEREQSTLEKYGIGVALGGGVSGFTNETLRDTTDDGGSWGVRVAVGTRSPIAFEAEYIGSAQDISALGLDNDAILVGNGVQGALRVNLLDYNVQPFLFGGLAWRHYDITNADFNTSAIAGSDDVLEVPMGAGVAFKYAGLMFDARGEYRYADQEDLVPEFTPSGLDDGAGSMHRWGANANVGVAF